MADAKKKETTERGVPDASRVALVPIANPATASDLLHLAAAIVQQEEGKIIALTVSLGDAEKEAQSIEALEEAIEKTRAEGYKVELETTTSTSISRGILDSARENGADLIILGIKKATRGQIQLGTVVTSVLDTAPCDVLIYRMGRKPTFKRVVVPLDNSFQSRVAARMGLRIAREYGTRIEAMHVQAGHRSEYTGLAVIEHALADIPEQHRIKRTVVSAQNPVEGVLSRINEDDLVIVGFNDSSNFERIVFGDVSEGILNRADGSVLVVSRAAEVDNIAIRTWRSVVQWLRPTLTPVEQDEIIRASHFNASLDIDYLTLIVVSATIAALGLLLNSAAVIIGAMLVAPLMSPLIALSAAMASGRIGIARRGFVSIVVGVLVALLVAFLLGMLMSFSVATQEMLARGQPTLLDAGVALASGVVGAYATARKDIPAALAGVAIAAALMPPLCTVGLGLALNDFDLAFGAALLFLTNIICIIVAGIVVFFWLGMRFRQYEHVTRRMQFMAIGLVVLAALPVSYELFTLTQQVSQDSFIQKEIRRGLQPAELIDLTIDRTADMRVVATIRTGQDLSVQDVVRLEQRIASEVGSPVNLELVIQRVIRITEVNDDDTLNNGHITVPAPSFVTPAP